MILSPGRTGSMFLASILAAQLREKIFFRAHTKEHKKINYYCEPVVHTHFTDKWQYLTANDILLLSARKNIAEIISSNWIGNKTERYVYYQSTDIKHIDLKNKEVIPKAFVCANLKNLYKYYSLFNKILHKLNRSKNSKNTYLLWYEDWIDDYSKLPFCVDLNKVNDKELPIRTPINKNQYVDILDLEQKILEYRHSIMIENIDDPIFTK